jgi:hypothetical protein
MYQWLERHFFRTPSAASPAVESRARVEVRDTPWDETLRYV